MQGLADRARRPSVSVVRTGVVLAACVAVLSGGVRWHSPIAAPVQAAVRLYVAHAGDSLDASLSALDSALLVVGDNVTPTRRVGQAMASSRAKYKRIEGIIEFYAPALASAFNARRQELDDDDAPPPSSTAPTGFPALEAITARRMTRSGADSARVVVNEMHRLTTKLRTLAPALVPTDAQIIEIVRLELARIETLGIAGFDAPRSGAAMRESAEAIAGLRSLLEVAGSGYWPAQESAHQALDSTLGRAADYLSAHPDFARFNRLAFIAGYAEPALRDVDQLRREAAIVPIRIQRAWRSDVASPFARGAFDANAYAPSGTPQRRPAIVELGQILFAEPALSGNGARSCASCHQPGRAFTDGRRTPVSLMNRVAVTRNTPTLLNAALQPAQFADERSVTLEDQVISVLASPAEMGSSLAHAVAVLGASARYKDAFAHAFGSDAPAVSGRHLQQALAAYERTLVALDSRFDEAARGDTLALTGEERHGFTLFMGKAGCGTCHFAPLFNGTMPPRYMSSDVEVVGSPASGRNLARVDADSGRARIDRLPMHYRAFKTPSLRNITRTAPYMHNGALPTLDAVMRFYEVGGGAGAGARIDNQTLSADSLHLTIAERRAVIAFLGALSPSTERVGAPSARLMHE